MAAHCTYVVGEIVAGTVKSKTEFGLFIRLDQTNADALCHITEVYDDLTEQRKKKQKKGKGKQGKKGKPSINLNAFQVGQRIARAKVLKVDKETGKMCVGLKPSYFEGEESQDEDVEKIAEKLGGSAKLFPSLPRPTNFVEAGMYLPAPKPVPL